MNKTLPERLAELIAAAVFISTVLYFAGHVVAAWLRGSFMAVTR
jgi:hypothetical protein